MKILLKLGEKENVCFCDNRTIYQNAFFVKTKDLIEMEGSYNAEVIY